MKNFVLSMMMVAALAPNPFALNYEEGGKVNEDTVADRAIFYEWKEIDKVTIEFSERLNNIVKQLNTRV